MERLTLNADVRTDKGKGTARSLRRSGIIPGVVYRKGKAALIQIPAKELKSFVNTTLGEQVLVNLKFPDGKTKIALMKDYQSDPVKGELLHTDFYEISLKEKVKVAVAASLTGEAIGVKRDGGILQYGLRDIEIECLPDKIPAHFEVDVTHLEVGHSVHVRDISFDKDIKVFTDPEEVRATILPPVKAVVEEAAEEIAEEIEEPEVVKKGKGEEEKEEEKKEE